MATVVRVAGATVAGAVYEVTEADLARLDRFEGAPTFYERRRVTVDVAGRARRATTYVLCRRHVVLGLPAAAYLRQIGGAYGALGIPLAGLTDALAISLAVDAPKAVDFVFTGPNVRPPRRRGPRRMSVSDTHYYLTTEGRMHYATVRTTLTGVVTELKRLNANLEALVAAVRELAAARRDA